MEYREKIKMPAKLDRCVKSVKADGKSESSAYAICTESTGYKVGKGSTKKDKKWVKKKAVDIAGDLRKMSRCWEGYEPVPGKEPYSEDSCRKKGKKDKKSDKVKKAGFDAAEEYKHAAMTIALLKAALHNKGAEIEKNVEFTPPVVDVVDANASEESKGAEIEKNVEFTPPVVDVVDANASEESLPTTEELAKRFEFMKAMTLPKPKFIPLPVPLHEKQPPSEADLNDAMAATAHIKPGSERTVNAMMMFTFGKKAESTIDADTTVSGEVSFSNAKDTGQDANTNALNETSEISPSIGSTTSLTDMQTNMKSPFTSSVTGEYSADSAGQGVASMKNSGVPIVTNNQSGRISPFQSGSTEVASRSNSALKNMGMSPTIGALDGAIAS
jgi:hypothetical protein